MSVLRKTLGTALTAVALTSAVMAGSTPAAAWGRGGWGGPLAAGLFGGFAAGAILGSVARPAYAYGDYPGYAPAYGYDPVPVTNPCYRGQSPVYDAYGNYIGMRAVRVCN